ncbi:hypothetical protein R1flu_027883 [Riccia fluitans]|uniref:Uncharacterized protein n=1 Tax=Riccia fluitans TaxID=41844 RepID=A0ABD1XKJ1_9MARC
MFPHHSLAHGPVQYPVPEGFGCVERYTEQGEHLTGTVPSRLMEWYLSQVSAGFAYLCRVLQESGDLMEKYAESPGSEFSLGFSSPAREDRAERSSLLQTVVLRLEWSGRIHEYVERLEMPTYDLNSRSRGTEREIEI